MELSFDAGGRADGSKPPLDKSPAATSAKSGAHAAGGPCNRRHAGYEAAPDGGQPRTAPAHAETPDAPERRLRQDDARHGGERAHRQPHCEAPPQQPKFPQEEQPQERRPRQEEPEQRPRQEKRQKPREQRTRFETPGEQQQPQFQHEPASPEAPQQDAPRQSRVPQLQLQPKHAQGPAAATAEGQRAEPSVKRGEGEKVVPVVPSAPASSPPHWRLLPSVGTWHHALPHRVEANTCTATAAEHKLADKRSVLLADEAPPTAPEKSLESAAPSAKCKVSEAPRRRAWATLPSVGTWAHARPRAVPAWAQPSSPQGRTR